MGAPRWFKLCWLGTRKCGQAVGTLLLWTSWLLLGLLLLGQGIIAYYRELAVPQVVLRRVEQRLAEAGLRATFGSARFDPTGQVLVQALRLSLDTLPEPVLSADSLYLELDPWDLAIGDVDVRHLRLSGAQLLVPALLSPSGRSEALVRDVEIVLNRAGGDSRWEVAQLTGRAGPVAVRGHGAWTPPARPHRDRSTTDIWRASSQAYPRLARQLAQHLSRLPALHQAELTLELGSSTEGLPVVTAQAHVGAVEWQSPTAPTISRWEARRLVATTTLPLVAPAALPPLAVDLSIAHLSGGEIVAEDLGIRAHQLVWAPDAWTGEVEVAAREVRLRDHALVHPWVQAQVEAWPQVQAQATTQLAGQPWSLGAALDVRTRAGTVTWDGRASSALLASVGRLLQRDLNPWLTLQSSPRITGEVTLEAGARPRSARARIEAGPVVARGVALHAASGDVHWQGTTAWADDIRLLTGTSEARGRYEMDTTSRDFRFLLAGRLQPADINGWFRAWWPRFWRQFDFGEGGAEADVAVSGRWGEGRSVAVFVAAQGQPVVLRGAAIDRVRTRLFVRPGHTNVMEFIGERGATAARGRFTYDFDLGRQEMARVTFDVRSDAALDPLPAILGSVGQTIVAPFTFLTPPRVHAHGRIDGPAAPGGRAADVTAVGDTVGDWTFYDFPLDGVSFNARLLNDTLLIEGLEAGVAGGKATGRVELRGLEAERHLGFDLAVTGSRLGESIRTLETWGARRRGETPPPVSRFQRQVADGRLDVALSAEGSYDDPYSLEGSGNAAITGADLGAINLLGVLSSFLRPTIFNFTTVQLDTAQANFDLKGRALHFHELRLTGPRAAIDASGTYRLDTQRLNFAAKVRPFDQSTNLLSATVGAFLSPLSDVLEVKLVGPLDQPSWSFAYGPTNLLRSITGTSAPPTPPEPAEPDDPSRAAQVVP